jgi:dTMP kinase
VVAHQGRRHRRHRPDGLLADANRLNLATSYGSAVPAAGIFIGLSEITDLGLAQLGWGFGGPVALALWANAVCLVASGLLCARIGPVPRASLTSASILSDIVEGWAYAWRTPLVRSLVGGIVAAFAAGGVVIGLARVLVGDLGASDAGYGTVFGMVFAGLGAGMWQGPRVLPGLGRPGCSAWRCRRQASCWRPSRWCRSWCRWRCSR